MLNKRDVILMVLVLFGTLPVHAQKEQTEICIDFRVNTVYIDSTYMDNAARLDEILQQINGLCSDTMRYVTQVTFSGVASPEGSYQTNRRLAKGRREALEKYIRSRIDLPDDLIIHDNDTYIPWSYLIKEVESSDIAYKQEILSILHGPSKIVPYYSNRTVDSRIPALQKLDNGRVWRTLLKRFFPKMRNACFVLVTLKDKPRQKPLPAPESRVTVSIPILEIPAIPIIKRWEPNLYVKTNAVGLALGITNLAVETDIVKHWSLTLPVYYSAWNYFQSTTKFRTFAIQPEVRYWLSEDNQGFFGGAHFGLAYYNIATDGDYRYQDHNRKTPAIGGGLSAGYRLPISKSNRWFIEFTLGAGVYPLHYDKFYNTPNTKDGLMIESIKKTYWGIDQAMVSLAYRFDLKKKGGKR